MADLKKLAQGRKAFTKPAEPAKATKPAKSDKTLEQTSTEEIGELETAFRDRITKEDNRRKRATDSETWFCVYFQTREQKNAFLRKYGLDKIGDKYLDGRVAERVLQRRLASRDAHKR